MDKLSQYRYKITGFIAFSVVFLFYLLQPKLTYQPHGLVWPEKGATLISHPAPQAVNADAVTFSLNAPIGAKLLGTVSVFLHDPSSCAVNSNKASQCRRHMISNHANLVKKSTQLALELDGANLITPGFKFGGRLLDCIPPNSNSPMEFRQWQCHYNVYHTDRLVSHPASARSQS